MKYLVTFQAIVEAEEHGDALRLAHATWDKGDPSIPQLAVVEPTELGRPSYRGPTDLRG